MHLNFKVIFKVISSYIIACIIWLVLLMAIYYSAYFLYGGAFSQVANMGSFIQSSQAPQKQLSPLERGQKIFHQCAICHSLYKGGPDKIGPNLYGIIGRRIASKEGYNYSEAMKNFAKENPIWTRQKLDSYIKNPQLVVPNNKMSFIGISTPQSRKELLLYLENSAKK